MTRVKYKTEEVFLQCKNPLFQCGPSLYKIRWSYLIRIILPGNILTFLCWNTVISSLHGSLLTLMEYNLINLSIHTKSNKEPYTPQATSHVLNSIHQDTFNSPKQIFTSKLGNRLFKISPVQVIETKGHAVLCHMGVHFIRKFLLHRCFISFKLVECYSA